MQVDILHPLATLHWEECAPLPKGILYVHCVVWKDRVWVGGGQGGSARLYRSSSDVTSWTELATPTSYFALATYHSQLVLVGGGYESEPKNKLWTLDTGDEWQPSLPPMPTRRCSSSAVSAGTPECLVVAGGKGVFGSALDTVEVLVEGQWSAVQPLPRECSALKSALHKGRLYFMGGDGTE